MITQIETARRFPDAVNLNVIEDPDSFDLDAFIETVTEDLEAHMALGDERTAARVLIDAAVRHWERLGATHHEIGAHLGRAAHRVQARAEGVFARTPVSEQPEATGTNGAFGSGARSADAQSADALDDRASAERALEGRGQGHAAEALGGHGGSEGGSRDLHGREATAPDSHALRGRAGEDGDAQTLYGHDGSDRAGALDPMDPRLAAASRAAAATEMKRAQQREQERLLAEDARRQREAEATAAERRKLEPAWQTVSAKAKDASIKGEASWGDPGSAAARQQAEAKAGAKGLKVVAGSVQGYPYRIYLLDPRQSAVKTLSARGMVQELILWAETAQRKLPAGYGWRLVDTTGAVVAASNKPNMLDR